MEKVLRKVPGTKLPTIKILHDVIIGIEGMPKWSPTTTYHVLKELGFK